MSLIQNLPALNASLNGISFLLVLSGYYFIKHKNILAHKSCMISAIVVSTLFLTSYLVYHYHVGSVRFTKEGWIRLIYFGILISHTILAITIIPLVIITVIRALRSKFAKHIRIARYTLPVWLYVSFTGVVIYIMLYKI